MLYSVYNYEIQEVEEALRTLCLWNMPELISHVYVVFICLGSFRKLIKSSSIPPRHYRLHAREDLVLVVISDRRFKLWRPSLAN